MRANLIPARTSLSDGPSTGKIWHGKSRLHCTFYQVGTNFCTCTMLHVLQIPDLYKMVLRTRNMDVILKSKWQIYDHYPACQGKNKCSVQVSTLYL